MRRHRFPVHSGLALLALTLLAPRARAQGGGRGFLFRQPTGSLAVRVGAGNATAGGDLFAFVTDQLTLSRGDFSAPLFAIDLGFWNSPRGEFSFGVSVTGASTRSEFRDWLDQNDLPIEQTTTLKREALTMSAKWYLAPRGRAIGRLAWVPARYAPYIGAGVGRMWYRFRQAGDFVDFTDNHVFNDTFQSKGWTWTGHAMAGVDIAISAPFFVTAEARYTRASADLGRDFIGFDRIDLSGFAVTAGLAARF